MMPRKSYGFTLLEMLIVVAIIAVLGYEDPDDIEKVVQLQQKQDGFQGFQDITIGDVSDKDKARWMASLRQTGSAPSTTTRS